MRFSKHPFFTTLSLFLTKTEVCDVSNKYWLPNKSFKKPFCTRYLTIENKKRFPTEAHSEPSRTSKMDLFVKIVDGWRPLTNFAKSSILDGRLGSKDVYRSRLEKYPFSTTVLVELTWMQMAGIFFYFQFQKSDSVSTFWNIYVLLHVLREWVSQYLFVF